MIFEILGFTAIYIGVGALFALLSQHQTGEKDRKLTTVWVLAWLPITIIGIVLKVKNPILHSFVRMWCRMTSHKWELSWNGRWCERCWETERHEMIATPGAAPYCGQDHEEWPCEIIQRINIRNQSQNP